MGVKCASCAEVTYITNPEAQQKELVFVASVVNPDRLTPYSFPDLDNPMNRGVSLSDGSSSLWRVAQNSGNLEISFTDPEVLTNGLRQRATTLN